jgi:hypothetical protein
VAYCTVDVLFPVILCSLTRAAPGCPPPALNRCTSQIDEVINDADTLGDDTIDLNHFVRMIQSTQAM